MAAGIVGCVAKSPFVVEWCRVPRATGCSGGRCAAVTIGREVDRSAAPGVVTHAERDTAAAAAVRTRTKHGMREDRCGPQINPRAAIEVGSPEPITK